MMAAEMDEMADTPYAEFIDAPVEPETNTRLDILSVVGVPCRFVEKLNQQH